MAANDPLTSQERNRRRRLRERARKNLPRLMHQQGGRCYWCGKQIFRYVPTSKPYRATVDHVVSIANGGGNGNNIVAACYSCNKARANPKARLRECLRCGVQLKTTKKYCGRCKRQIHREYLESAGQVGE